MSMLVVLLCYCSAVIIGSLEDGNGHESSIRSLVHASPPIEPNRYSRTDDVWQRNPHNKAATFLRDHLHRPCIAETHMHTIVSVKRGECREMAGGQQIIFIVKQTSAAIRHNPLRSTINSSHNSVVIFSFSQPPDESFCDSKKMKTLKFNVHTKSDSCN